jgi:uncharacterized membrane protein
MRPLTVITGILLGSCAAIAISLAMVVIVFLVLGDEYPRLQHEFRPLLISMFIFLGMTVLTAGSFYSLVRMLRWRLWSQLFMWLGLSATIWYFLP